MDSPPDPIKVKRKDITDLCDIFKQNAYSANYETPEVAGILAKCKALLELDYKVVEINNKDGSLCSHYPSKILICQSEISKQDARYEVKNEALSLETEADINQLRSNILKARKGRCRARFPIPVIFYKGKNICRSGTTAHFVEILGRAAVETVGSYVIGTSEDELAGRGDDDQFNDDQNLNLESSVRKNDIQLLRMYNVENIFDLMVEQRKVKYGVYVTSSESADAENRYGEFKIFHVPYPGCEFFSDFHHTGKQGVALYFDWSQKMVDQIFDIPDIGEFADMQVKWDEYKTWDIVTLTRNYLMLILKKTHESNSGILVHCISGWDRTPLFISLIRLSLWADGLIHKSLSAGQILYFTIAYDWMLFGHNLKNRLEKFEDIFFFCFYVLKYLTDFELNNKGLLIHPEDHSSSSKGNSPCYDNGNTTPKVGDCSGSNFNVPDDVLLHYRDNETDMFQEEEEMSDSDVEREDFSEIETPPSQTPSSQGSNESNGNSIRYPSSDSSEGPKRSSPVPIVCVTSAASDTDTSGSWVGVTSTGSIRSNDEMALLKTSKLSSKSRYRRLHKVRDEFYKMYYHCIPVSYRQGQSVFGQVLGNLSEKVGLS